MKQFIIRFLFILLLNLSVSFFNLFSIISHPPSVICYHSLYADTLVYWEPEQRLTYDSIPQLHCQVWAYDSFVHILVNYDIPLMYLRSSDYGQTWSDTVRVSVIHSNSLQTLIQQDFVVYFVWSEQREGPLMSEARVDTDYAFFRKSDDYGMTLDSVIFLGKGCWVSMDAKRESVFVGPAVWNSPSPEDGAYFIYSADTGYSWSEYLPIVDSATQPNIVYRNGILHFAGSRDYKILYTRSTDLGNSWSTPTIITAPNTVLPKRPVLALGPNQNVYIAWTDNKYSGAMQFDDVLFRKSTDDGLTWGAEQRLTPDSHCDAGGALDMVSQDSMIFIVWNFIGLGYPTPCSLFFLASTHCGETWQQRETVKEGFNIGISDANVAVVHDYVYVIWRDNQYGSTDEVSMRRGSILPVGIEERDNFSNQLIVVFPNPFNQALGIKFSPSGNYVKIKLFDITGKEVGYGIMKDELGSMKIDTKDLPCGVYFVQIKAGNESMIKKVVKVK